MGKTIVYFVRHGDRLEISDNSKIPGPGLSTLGHTQAKNVAKKFLKLNGVIDYMYTSTMKRAMETAEYIGKAVGKKPVCYEELCEFNKFVWKGKYYHPHFWKHYIRYDRAKTRFNKILLENKGKKIVLVVHGNVIKGIIGKKLGVPFLKRGNMDYSNCFVSKARFDGTKLDYIYYYNASHV
ncbi:MAG: histidine phosphatase family protein [Candidatus Woesearchaeota archaeon]